MSKPTCDETPVAPPTLRSLTDSLLAPTAEEDRRNRAHFHVLGVIVDAIERIAEGCGDLTEPEIREALSQVDLADEWTDWCEG